MWLIQLQLLWIDVLPFNCLDYFKPNMRLHDLTVVKNFYFTQIKFYTTIQIYNMHVYLQFSFQITSDVTVLRREVLHCNASTKNVTQV